MDAARTSGNSYRIEEKLGAGAFGAVYLTTLTTPTGLEMPVALKVLHPEQSTRKNIARLRREAEMLTRVKHRAVVQVLDLVELSVGWALAMEFVDGIDLVELCKNLSVPARPALQIVEEVAAALHELSNTGDGALALVHRDIKLANIILEPSGGVKLLDFGIADGAAEEPCDAGNVWGTPRYMAPERFDGRATPACDIYALGIVFAEVLGHRMTGSMGDRRPIQAALARLERIAGADARELFRRMTEFDPSDRPTALEVSRVARELANTAPGPALADWAMGTLPCVIEERTAGPDQEDPLLGLTLAPTTEVLGPARSIVIVPLLVLVTASLVLLAFAGGALTTGMTAWLSSGTTLSVSSQTLMDLPDRSFCASIAPDGASVTYAHAGSIFIHPLGGTARRLLETGLPDHAACSVLSPTGDRIAARVKDHIEIRRVADGSLLHTLEVEAKPTDWGEGGLLLVRGDTLVQVDDKGSMQEMGHSPGLRGARWHPSANRVLMVTDGAAVWMGTDGTVEATSIYARDADILPNGDVLFSDQDGDEGRLFVWHPGGEPELQVHLEGFIHQVRAARTANRALVVAHGETLRTQLHEWRRPGQGWATSRVLPMSQDTVAAFFTDKPGELVQVKNDRTPPRTPRRALITHVIVRTTLDGDVLEELGSLESRQTHFGGLSFDKKRLYFTQRTAAGEVHLAWLSTDHPGPPQRLLQMPESVLSSVVSPDASLVAGMEGSGRSCLYATAQTGMATPVSCAPEGWEVANWAGNGHVVVSNAGEVALLNVETGLLEPQGSADYQYGFGQPGRPLLVIEREAVSWVGPSGSAPAAVRTPATLVSIAATTPDLSRLILGETRVEPRPWLVEFE